MYLKNNSPNHMFFLKLRSIPTKTRQLNLLECSPHRWCQSWRILVPSLQHNTWAWSLLARGQSLKECRYRAAEIENIISNYITTALINKKADWIGTDAFLKIDTTSIPYHIIDSFSISVAITSTVDEGTQRYIWQWADRVGDRHCRTRIHNVSSLSMAKNKYI